MRLFTVDLSKICRANFIFAKNGRPHRVAPTLMCRRHTSFHRFPCAVPGVMWDLKCFTDSRKATICFSICSGRCPHRPNSENNGFCSIHGRAGACSRRFGFIKNISFIKKIKQNIRLWRIGSSGTPNPTDLSLFCAFSGGNRRGRVTRPA